MIAPVARPCGGSSRSTGVKIDIEDDGTVLIASDDATAAEAAGVAEALVEGEAQIGRIYTGKVSVPPTSGPSWNPPGTDGLVHISQWRITAAESVEDVVRVGDETGHGDGHRAGHRRIRLSRQAVLEG